jgi:hypothetical protein
VVDVFVVQWNKNARLEQMEKYAPRANRLRNDVSDAMHANKAARWRGLLLAGG